MSPIEDEIENSHFFHFIMVIQVTLYVDVVGKVNEPKGFADLFAHYVAEEVSGKRIPKEIKEEFIKLANEGLDFTILNPEEVKEYLRKKK